jgi:hypothetical protein
MRWREFEDSQKAATPKTLHLSSEFLYWHMEIKKDAVAKLCQLESSFCLLSLQHILSSKCVIKSCSEIKIVAAFSLKALEVFIMLRRCKSDFYYDTEILLKDGKSHIAIC